jgi:hypothetical protein
MAVPGTYLIRNVEWKSWLKRSISPKGSDIFGAPTPHENDACGVALFTACVLIPRHKRNRVKE